MLVFQFIPRSAIDDPQDYNSVSIIEDINNYPCLLNLPFSTRKTQSDSVIFYNNLYLNQQRQEQLESFIQIFDNGCAEYVTTSSCIFADVDGKRYFNGNYENDLLRVTQAIMQTMKKLNIDQPIYVKLILTGVKDAIFEYQGSLMPSSNIFTEDSYFQINENIIYSYEISPVEVIKPLINKVCNAVNIVKSPNIDNNGNWTGIKLPNC